MSWPLSNPGGPPNFDSGFVSVPTTLANVPNSPAGAAWIVGANFANGTPSAITITVQDGSGNVILPAIVVPANADLPLEWAFMPASGTFQWFASAAGLVGKLWGWF